MKRQQKVSIIVPVYNCEEFLEKCILSVLSQTYSNLELILINDGSTDNSGTICNKYKSKDSRVIYIEQKNSGVSTARNKGLIKATGDFIFFLDSDDYIEDNVINDLINKTSNEILYSCCNKTMNNDKVINKNDSNIKLNREDIIKQIVTGKRIGVVWGFLFNAKQIKSNNIKFDIKTGYMEDTIFLVEYLTKTKVESINYIEHCYYYHCQNINSITKNNSNIFNNCKNIEYSLNAIDSLTNYEFSKNIKDKKIRLIEERLSCLNSNEQLKKILKDIDLDYYKGNNIRFKIFSIIYKSKNTILLKLYFIIRKLLKYVKNKIEKLV